MDDGLHLIDTATHGALWIARWSGTNADGGEFDAAYACLLLLRDGEPAGLEIFELDDELARARFVDLSAGRKR